jgi:hypothetical protein
MEFKQALAAVEFEKGSPAQQAPLLPITGSRSTRLSFFVQVDRKKFPYILGKI